MNLLTILASGFSKRVLVDDPDPTRSQSADDSSASAMFSTGVPVYCANI
jgi:hypothetical protein